MNFAKPKKYISLSLILASLFLVNPTRAQIISSPEDLGTSSSASLTEEQTTQAESSSTPSSYPPTTKARATLDNKPGVVLTAVRQERILNLAANISNRMDAAVERLTNISSRLEQRIIKLEEAGMETSLAREKLVSTNETLTTAHLRLSDIDTLVNVATFSTEPKNNWQTVRGRYQEIGSLVRQAHFALRESITFLKNPVLKNQETPPNSNETNPISELQISN